MIRFGFKECPIHNPPHARKRTGSVILPGEIPYSPHSRIASALLHLKCEKQCSGREDLEGKRPFLVGPRDEGGARRISFTLDDEHPDRNGRA